MEPLPKINPLPIAAASDGDLDRWAASLERALAAPRPDDERPSVYDECTRWVEQLLDAIKAELDRRRENGDIRHQGGPETRAAI